MTATSAAPPRQLAAINPLQQLKAGHLPRRLVQLYVGLVLYGASMALMVQSHLGPGPWDVLHTGVARHVPLNFGTIAIITSFVVLLAWIPLRQWPGLGTVSNAIVIGIAANFTLAVVDQPGALWLRIVFVVSGVVINALAGALYIGAQLGPGPRDGLMTGLVRRTGLSVRVIRTAIEVTVVAIGFLLGGVVGLGTVLYALSVGPLLQIFLPWFTVRLKTP
ncbi:YczE/YyaS/YitT family protein [Kribbella antibiotica]|uniref:membrane protein YczE n=1 Tax=Kribbella antibiotica TaxID=190195 RepID=UPI0014055D4A|nr:hypothetical protein [Kribbella antibiotica]